LIPRHVAPHLPLRDATGSTMWMERVLGEHGSKLRCIGE
jgi:hypothetical protein